MKFLKRKPSNLILYYNFSEKNYIWCLHAWPVMWSNQHAESRDKTKQIIWDFYDLGKVSSGITVFLNRFDTFIQISVVALNQLKQQTNHTLMLAKLFNIHCIMKHCILFK